MARRSGAVHVATTQRRYKNTVYTTHLLRRTYREGGKVKHETLGNISHLPPDLIDILRRALAGETFVAASDAFRIKRSLPHGHVSAVLGTIRKLGLEKIISSKPCRQRDLVVALVAERILHPGSKLAATRSWSSSSLAEELGVADAQVDEVYGALDWLAKAQRRIERKLAKRHLDENSYALYDLSSSSYLGRCCVLARLGHNRDGRKGVPSIAFGLMTDSQGRPVSITVYPGNTGDPKTVPDQVEKLKDQFKLDRVVLVGDRGMLTETQLGKLRKHPTLGWISALRSAGVRKLVESGVIQMSLFDEHNLAEISSPDYPDERLVACMNPLLAEERRRKREDLLKATEVELERISREVARRTRKPLTQSEIGLKVGRIINKYKMAKHFRLTIEDSSLTWRRRDDSIEAEAALDGIYVIRTSESSQALDAESIVRDYKNLSVVERAFRCMKTIDLEVRPIYLRLEDHVRAHFFICMLAYYVEWHLRRALRPLLFEDETIEHDRARRDPVAPAKPTANASRKKATRTSRDGFTLHSLATLLEELATQAKNTCSVAQDISGATFTQITEATPLQRRAFELLDL